jgi:hypothetical protein
VKKQVNRERKLPAFSLSIGELEVLWSRLRKLFDDPADIYARIQIRLPLEQLEFANFEELKQYPHLPSRVTNFDIWLSQKERHITIRSQWRSGFRTRVSATAETEAWSGGAIETVFSFMQSHKLWYSWFLSTPVFWALILIVAIAPMLFLIAYDNPPVATAVIPKGVVIGWLGALALYFLWFSNERLLPPAVIRISDSQGFVRKHAVELQLALAAVSIILVVIGWFVAK